MESWEHIAPELPPHWSVDKVSHGNGEYSWNTVAADGTVTERGFCERHYAVEDCWEQFGTPRKRWAELIAVERVREVAAKKWGGQPDTSAHQSKRFSAFTVSVSGVYIGQSATGRGPTLCNAAWACIQALGGGE